MYADSGKVKGGDFKACGVWWRTSCSKFVTAFLVAHFQAGNQTVSLCAV